MPSPSLQDIQTPIDPTAYQSISGSQLLQILSSLKPWNDKGLAIITTDIAGNPTVPDARTNTAFTSTEWQRYLWIRVSAASVGVYVWNPGGAVDATYLQWQSINIAGIGAGSIQGFMIADNTVQSVKIVSLDWSKLTGVPSGLPPGGAAGGALTATFPNPSIAVGAVVSSMIANATIVPTNIALASLTLALDAPVSGSAKDMARVNAAATGMEAFTPPVIFTSANVTPTANAGKLIQVNAGATDFDMVSPTTVGRVLQVIETGDIAVDTTNIGSSSATTLPTTSTTKHAGNLDIAITPLNAGSTLLVEGTLWLCSSNSAQLVVAALFQDAGANAIGAGCNDCQNSGNRPVPVPFRYAVASGSLVARTFKVGFGGTGANTRYNSTDGATTMFGGALGIRSWIRVTEYV